METKLKWKSCLTHYKVHGHTVNVKKKRNKQNTYGQVLMNIYNFIKNIIFIRIIYILYSYTISYNISVAFIRQIQNSCTTITKTVSTIVFRIKKKQIISYVKIHRCRLSV